MRQRMTVVMWVLAVAFLVALPVPQALADQPIAPKVKTSPGFEPTVPRGMPDLVNYWDFDPPKSPLFDVSKITVSGDMRIRPEYRNNSNFGLTNVNGSGRATGASGQADASQFVQQWARLGINYAVSPDVDSFVQMQYAKNWGANSTAAGVAGNAAAAQVNTQANDPNTLTSLGVRQAYMLIRNLGVDGLSMKAGRQLIVMGNHRLFGHFDWNNVGFSFDGVTLQYNQPLYEVYGGWVRLADAAANASANCLGAGSACAGSSPAVGGGTVAANTAGGANADLYFARLAFKPMAGLSIEPLWVWFNNNQSPGAPGAAGTPGAVAAGNYYGTAPHANGQTRHTLGGRVAARQGMFDGTFEYYWQTGSMALLSSTNRLHINANAMAAEGGITVAALPWTPRFGLEFNYASGDGNAKNCNGNTGAGCGGNANTFENLYPTNHILMGYADRMAWRNMVGYSASLQAKPSSTQQLDFRFWIFRKANNGDCWYTASQACFSTATNTGNTVAAGTAGSLASNIATSNSLYKEIDGVYTLFFKGNKVAWQTGASYLISGQMLNQLAAGNAAANGSSAVNSIWAYTQLHINF